MHPELTRQLGDRPVPSDRRQRHLRLEPRIMFLPCPLHVLLPRYPRVLGAGLNGVESHVVDPASIAVPRRHRRAKTDAIDGETLLRTLMAWQRGEPRVCAMTVPPSPSEEDCRRF